MDEAPRDNTRAGIAFVLVGMTCITANDAIIKFLSDSYPLHQIVFIRSVIAILGTLGFLYAENAFRVLWPRHPGLQILRASLIVLANMFFFLSLALLPLATATAIFFVAPLLITLLAIPVLGETVGIWRLSAIGIGFLGVLVISSGGSGEVGEVEVLGYVLPVLGAGCYAGMVVLTRKLSASAPASALAFYMQAMFIVVGAGFFIVAGDGRFAQGVESEAFAFLLRAWRWPSPEDIWLFALLGALAAVVGFTMSKAYGLAKAATISSFEYSALALAILWGLVIFGTWPGFAEWVGIAMIAGAGLLVFFRESARGEEKPARPHLDA